MIQSTTPPEPQYRHGSDEDSTLPPMRLQGPRVVNHRPEGPRRLEEIDTARIQCGGKEIQGVQRHEGFTLSTFRLRRRTYIHSSLGPDVVPAWHTFHDAEYPYRSEKRVKLMLKGSGRQDALIPRRPEKSPVLISDLAELFRTLSGRGPEAEAVKDLAVVAFWGMARMAELTYTSNSGRINFKKGTTAQDVLYFQNAIIVNIHEAKTAKPGEVQVLKLRSINSPLCPVKAIERRRLATTLETDSLFGYESPKGRINLTKRRVNQVLAAAWHDLGRPHLTGHSFRVGGATLRHAVGIDTNEIKWLGRWTTDCYKRYIKPLSREDVITSLSTLELQSFSRSI
ncbi:hypothetical protein PSTT_04642 [Puccinia striiformis]|uniref:Tyr recombinase domain-containing protein n=1 Tax=Puccinia striiformis TaxID=27350 RepID=A0A2S4VSI4_9BASI|nr:hypothetical protein PSTT_04642 [Puccinia striiformis]